MITCDFAFLADFAAERGGFITAHGIGIDNLSTPQLPVTHPHLYLVVQLRCPVAELGSKNLSLKLFDDTGKIALEQNGQANFLPPAVGDSSVARMVLGFHMLTFKAYGTSNIVVELEGQVMANLPFQITPPAQVLQAAVK